MKLCLQMTTMLVKGASFASYHITGRVKTTAVVPVFDENNPTS